MDSITGIYGILFSANMSLASILVVIIIYLLTLYFNKRYVGEIRKSCKLLLIILIIVLCVCGIDSILSLFSLINPFYLFNKIDMFAVIISLSVFSLIILLGGILIIVLDLIIRF